MGCNPEGCEKVAGGRSEAQTSGHELVLFVYLIADRWSSTTGYYLSRLWREDPPADAVVLKRFPFVFRFT